jgi:nucleotide-binding universal stress UspA family protein
MHILLAVDGSDASTRAARHVAKLARQLAEAPTLTLINVSLPLIAPAERKLGRKASTEYYESNSRHALRNAHRVLERAKLGFREAFLVGDPAEQIALEADRHDADLIVMGSRGQTALKSLVMGSVATKVLALSKVPLTVVR